MKSRDAIKWLDAIDYPNDPERAHQEADAILLWAASDVVAVAYQRAVVRTGQWWFA